MMKVNPQAQIAIRSLLPIDKERVERHISLLERFPQDHYVRGKTKELKGAKDNLYIMRATANMRIIFRYAGGELEVVDIVTRDRLERMHDYAA